jgi:hypothetical protein
VTNDGQSVELTGARDIAKLALSSESARQTFVTKLFEHMVKQAPAAYGLETMERLSSQFAADDFNIQTLMVKIAVVAASHGKPES